MYNSKPQFLIKKKKRVTKLLKINKNCNQNVVKLASNL